MSSFYFRSGFFVSVFLFLFLAHENVSAQKKYWVSFSNKAGVSFNPFEYFSQRTIERRVRYGISLCDSSDFPVRENYIEQVKVFSDSMGWPSRWLNGVAVYTSEENSNRISRLPFVISVEHLGFVLQLAEKNKENISAHQRLLKPKQMALLKYQTARLEGNLFSEKNIDGKGILIAVFDGGFPNVNHSEAFSHLFKENRIKATYDFVSKSENVFSNNHHGSMTLSCIGGKYNNINIGLASGADFLLARTERANGEAFAEEENWLAAAEWADKNGADIISSSLGYTFHRYFNNEMNGKKSLVARAASMAAAKGILVVNAAGNEGSNRWKFLSTPADADSVLAVGGTNPYRDMRIEFSSSGPTSDGRLKPEVCAPAEVMAADGNGMSHAFGTSFACPLVAGFAACVWQMHREWNNVELYHKIQEAGHLYPYFDYAHGYGIPQASHFISQKENNVPTFSFEIDKYELKVILNEKYTLAQDEMLLGYMPHRNLYYHIKNADGTLAFYSVIDAQEKEVLSLDVRDYSTAQELTVHFEGIHGNIPVYRFQTIKLMKKIIFLIWLAIPAQKIFSQTVLLQEDHSTDTVPETFGQNLKHFSHAVLAFGFVFGESDKQFPLKGGSSYEFRAGIRTKRKVTPVFSYGYDFFYRAISYYIDQSDEKKFPDSLKHKDQKFNFFSFGSGIYSRFNFDPHRGNFLGTYIDAGITGEWDFTARTVTHDVLPGDEKVRVVTKHLDYVNSFSSRVFLRGGRSRVLVYGTYRITDHFKSSSEFPELPRFIAGIELNIF